MQQKQKLYIGLGVLGVLLLAGILFLAPFPGMFRGDLGPNEPSNGPSGMYLTGETKSGTGVLLSSSGSLSMMGQYPVEMKLSTQSAEEFTISGLLHYDPSSLSISMQDIATSSGFTLDAALSTIQKDENGNEVGKIHFSFIQTTKNSSSPQIAQLLFTPLIPKITSSIWLEQVNISKQNSAMSTALFLSREHPISTQINKTLHVELQLGDLHAKTFEKEGSGTVLQIVRTLENGNVIESKNWTELDSNTTNVRTHHTKEVKDKFGKTTYFSRSIEPTQSQGGELSTRKSSETIASQKDTLGRLRNKQTEHDGKIHSIFYHYSLGGITTEEWWGTPEQREKHLITYPNGDTFTEDILPAADNQVQIKSTWSSGKSTSSFLWKKKAGKMDAEIKAGTHPLLEAGITKDLPECKIFLPKSSAISEQGTDLFSLPADTDAHVQNICALELYHTEKAYGLISSFLPFSIKYTVDSAEEYTPMYLNPSTQLWEKVPEEAIVEKSKNTIKLLTQRTGRYGLLHSSSH